MTELTHLGTDGRPRMVDVSGKASTARAATAQGIVRMSAETLSAARRGGPKGSVLQVATLAGITAAKRTSDLIPLCHPLPLDGVDVAVEPDETIPGVRVAATARTTGRTGVEMEALTAASVACLTVYDMLKAKQRDMVVTDIRLLRKEGGKSGTWQAEA